MTHATLFVFGSFSQGMVHYNKIEQFVEAQRDATTRGSVYSLEVGFPVFLKDGETKIEGTVVTLRDSEMLLPILDAFHGFSAKTPEKSLFVRTEIEIECEGETTKSWVYMINPVKMPKRACLIADGDWKRMLRERVPMTEGLTPKERAYIAKLGKASGRDIVPINDMDLYKILMRKELIVDKGRRLALTALGQECYRFMGDN